MPNFIKLFNVFAKQDSDENVTHLKMFGGKDIFVSPMKPGAFVKIPDAYGKGKLWGIGMSEKEYNNFLSLDDNHRRQFLESYIKLYNPELHSKLKLSETNDLSQRRQLNSPYTSDGTPVSSNLWKHYPDEPLNPRIGKVIPFVDEGGVYLKMTVDGKEKDITIYNKNTVDAFNAGVLPLNVLANRALEKSESMQVNAQNRFEMDIHENLEPSQAQSFSFRR